MLTPSMFRRMDESPDAEFYEMPRLVTHIDDAAIAAVTELYREHVPPGGAVLDLMSSWVSHLPGEVTYRCWPANDPLAPSYARMNWV